MGKTTRANVQPQSRIRGKRLALLERVCQVSGRTVRHIIRLDEEMSPEDQARDIEQYRDLGWTVHILWRGTQWERCVLNGWFERGTAVAGFDDSS